MVERQSKYRFANEEAELMPPPPPAAGRSELRAGAAAHGRVRKRRNGSVSDKFRVDPDKIPAGWTYEWKRHTTIGQEDPAYQVECAEQGWTPVAVDRHPEFMPPSYKGPIVRDGMMLMERPEELTREAREEDMANARMTVKINEARLHGAPPGSFDRTGATIRHEHAGALPESFEIPR